MDAHGHGEHPGDDGDALWCDGDDRWWIGREEDDGGSVPMTFGNWGIHKHCDVEGSSPVKMAWSEMLGSGGSTVAGAKEEDGGGGGIPVED